MEIAEKEFNVLVIAGYWNKAIFNSDWMEKYIFQDEKKFDIEIPLGNVGSFRFKTKELRVYTLADRLHLSITSQSNENLQTVEDIAIKFADLLPHTPVTAFGINFEFEIKDIEKLKNIFEFSDSKKMREIDLEYKRASIARVFDYDDHLLNFIINKDDERYRVNFNYHYEIKDLVDFKSKFESNIILNYKEHAKNLLKDIYCIELKD